MDLLIAIPADWPTERIDGERRITVARGVTLTVSSVTGAPDEDDDELAAYNAYLARLTAEASRHGKWHGLR